MVIVTEFNEDVMMFQSNQDDGSFICFVTIFENNKKMNIK